ncbi:hypothetical protein [Staphylococcus epidermidis]|nr:hypothetical protein [Staphylococcus epidermidis]
MKGKGDDVGVKMNGQWMRYEEVDDYCNSMGETLIENGIEKGIKDG